MLLNHSLTYVTVIKQLIDYYSVPSIELIWVNSDMEGIAKSTTPHLTHTQTPQPCHAIYIQIMQHVISCHEAEQLPSHSCVTMVPWMDREEQWWENMVDCLEGQGIYISPT